MFEQVMLEIDSSSKAPRVEEFRSSGLSYAKFKTILSVGEKNKVESHAVAGHIDLIESS